MTKDWFFIVATVLLVAAVLEMNVTLRRVAKKLDRLTEILWESHKAPR